MLIKDDKNHVAQRCAPQSEVRLPEFFEGPTVEQSGDGTIPEEDSPITKSFGDDTTTVLPSTSAPTVTLHSHYAGLVTMSAEFLQALV